MTFPSRPAPLVTDFAYGGTFENVGPSGDVPTWHNYSLIVVDDKLLVAPGVSGAFFVGGTWVRVDLVDRTQYDFQHSNPAEFGDMTVDDMVHTSGGDVWCTAFPVIDGFSRLFKVNSGSVIEVPRKNTWVLPGGISGAPVHYAMAGIDFDGTDLWFVAGNGSFAEVAKLSPAGPTYVPVYVTSTEVDLAFPLIDQVAANHGGSKKGFLIAPTSGVIRRFKTSDGTLDATSAVAAPRSLAGVTPTGNIFSLNGATELRKYDKNLTLLTSIDLAPVLKETGFVTYDPVSDVVWVLGLNDSVYKGLLGASGNAVAVRIDSGLVGIETAVELESIGGAGTPISEGGFGLFPYGGNFVFYGGNTIVSDPQGDTLFGSTVTNIPNHGNTYVLSGGGSTPISSGSGAFLPVHYGMKYATGDLTFTGIPANGDTVTLNAKVYTFQTVLTDVDGNVQIGVDAAESLANLAAAIILGPGVGVAYANSMTINSGASATVWGPGDVMRATALTPGTGGNAIGTTETGANMSWGAATLAGGTAGASFDNAPNGTFIVSGLNGAMSAALVGQFMRIGLGAQVVTDGHFEIVEYLTASSVRVASTHRFYFGPDANNGNLYSRVGSPLFIDAAATFITDNVLFGDLIFVYTGVALAIPKCTVYVVYSVDSETQITITSKDGYASGANENLINSYVIYRPPGKTTVAQPGEMVLGHVDQSWKEFDAVYESDDGLAELADGTIRGRYRRVGNQVDVSVSITCGADTTFGSDQFFLPVPSDVAIRKPTQFMDIFGSAVGSSNVVPAPIVTPTFLFAQANSLVYGALSTYLTGAGVALQLEYSLPAMRR